MIHSNYDKLEGKYWMKLKDEYKDIEKVITVIKIIRRNTVWGLKYDNVFHISDVERMKVKIYYNII